MEKDRQISEAINKRGLFIVLLSLVYGCFLGFVTLSNANALDSGKFSFYYTVIDSQVIGDGTTKLTLDLNIVNLSEEDLTSVSMKMVDPVEFSEYGETTTDNFPARGNQVLRGNFDRPIKLFGNFKGTEVLYLKIDYVGSDGNAYTEIIKGVPLTL
jgi:hypothetical protein